MITTALLATSFNAIGDAIVAHYPPMVVDANWNAYPMPDGVYERYDFPIFAADFEIVVDEENLPNPGDAWEIRLSYLTEPDEPLVYQLLYDAGSDCLYDMFGILDCHVVEDAQNGIVVYNRFLLYFSGQCMPEGLWALAASYGGNYIGDGPYPFTPSVLRPGAPEVSLSATQISPGVPPSFDRRPDGGPFPASMDPGLEAGTVRIGITVPDDLGCRHRLDDELLEVRARIVPGSGSHRHFDDELPGTGELHFLDPRVQEGDDPTTVQFRMLGEEEKIFYLAGEYGVVETISVEALEATEPAITVIPLEITTNAELPEMVKLDGAGDWFDVVGSGMPGCDAEHNDGPYDRSSDYLLPHVRNLAATLAYDYFDRTGLRLSFNDASLQMGGLFDKGSQDRNARCHATHRLGIDIDLNRAPLNPEICLPGTGPRLENCMVRIDKYGKEKNALDYLDVLAEKTYSAHYWRNFDRDQSPKRLHYRFPR